MLLILIIMSDNIYLYKCHTIYFPVTLNAEKILWGNLQRNTARSEQADNIDSIP
jgi:hypothetical protein